MDLGGNFGDLPKENELSVCCFQRRTGIRLRSPYREYVGPRAGVS